KKKAASGTAKSGRPRPSHAGHVTTSMPGTVVAVKVKAGDKVTAGDGVLVIEAMKMENEIQAAATGVVVAVHVVKGDSVTPDESLLEIQPE
ncbi:MAG: biotin/lipoyl-binding protein, partial [Gammaproteobacteria bacterium]|nr:biotin/lipoyl-binding protein [Gammaproteobacteria bacterium]